MKNKILSIIGAGLLILTAWSCRDQSDELMAYDHNDEIVFNDAETSFAAKFKIMWNGMNQNYAIWDYEAEQGVDWDAMYNEFYPQFAALDQRGDDETVTDDELTELMKKFLGPLHDGHFYMTITNHKTGSSIRYQPSEDRLLARDDFDESLVSPSLQYYANVANGEIETDGSGNPIAIEHSTTIPDIINVFATTEGKGLQWILTKMQELEALSSPTDHETFLLQQLKNLRVDLSQINGKMIPEVVEYWNSLLTKYSFLEVPGFDYIDPAFAAKCGINVKYALLKGNIAYFYLSSFNMTAFLDDNASQSTLNMSNPATQQHVQQMRQVWRSWFDDVQQLHKNGTLGGVIIDLRGNTGGNMDDSQYIVGSLVPSGGIFFGYQRYKRGTGRYEYSPLMPAIVSSLSEAHETITEPIVVMTNAQSVSMSETSTLCVKTLPNGTQIGNRSFGAICALTGNETNSYNYAGFFGVEGVTPVFGHVPSMASFTIDKKLIEAEGITPDIQVDLDLTQFAATGKDTQLDRALQFIRTGQ